MSLFLQESMSRDFEVFGGYKQDFLLPVILGVLIILFIIYKILLWFSPNDNKVETNIDISKKEESSKPEIEVDQYINLSKAEIIDLIINHMKKPMKYVGLNSYEKNRKLKERMEKNPLDEEKVRSNLEKESIEYLKRTLRIYEPKEIDFSKMLKDDI